MSRHRRRVQTRAPRYSIYVHPNGRADAHRLIGHSNDLLAAKRIMRIAITDEDRVLRTTWLCVIDNDTGLIVGRGCMDYSGAIKVE